jgi:hypothetical protein
MAGYLPIDGGGVGGGILYPDSADRPFPSNSARNSWANNNKSELIKDTTVVNVGGTQWYLWTGESNPDTVSTSLWMDADQIVPGEKGDGGDNGVSITSTLVNSDGELVISKDDGTDSNVGKVVGESAYQVWISEGNTGTEQDYIDSLKGDKGDDGAITATASTNELLKVDSNGSVVGTGVFSGKDGSATFGSGSIDIGMHNISSAGEGVEATNQGTGESYSFVFAGQGDDTGPVHRILSANQTDITTTPTKSKQLTNHVSRLTATVDFRLLKLPVTIDAVSAQTNVTMQVTALNGEDVWSYGPFDMVSGINTFTPNTILDFRVGQYDVTFTSPDGDVVLLGDASPVSGLDVVYAILPAKEWSDETLANIKLGADIVRSLEPGTNIELNIDADGNLTISSTVSGGGSALDVDDQETEVILTATGIASSYDAGTKTTTLTVDPTNIDLSDYALLGSNNTFTAQQKIANAELKVEKADGTNLLRVRPDNETVTVKGALTSDDVKTLSLDSGQNSNLQIKHNGNTRLFIGDTQLTATAKIQAQRGLDIQDASTYTGSIDDNDALVNKLYVDGMSYYKGQGLGIPAAITISSNTVEQNTPVAYFENSLSHEDETIITIDEFLVAAETIIKVSALAQYNSKAFLFYHGATDNGAKTIRRGETWRIRLDASGTNEWFYERVDDGTRITRGLGGRLTPVEHPYVGLFQYADNMPYHLLVETPTSSRLVHEFPRNKTFRFTPISTAREHDNNVVINQANQSVADADLSLGQYSDIPLYIIEPNVVVNRDQRAWINFPANMTLDVSSGFYAFGTVSGWCGNASTEGNVGVYVGTSESFRTYTQNIGLVLGNSGVFLLDGQNLRTAQNSASFGFNIEPGVTHMYRYAFYVAPDGLMTYYIVDLNTGQVSTGTQQCNLASIGSNPKMYVSYDRYGNNTSAMAIAETHLVVNSVGDGEGRWNWRN